MSFLNWDLKYHYGVQKMDDDHDEMATIIEELYNAMVMGKGKKTIVALFHELMTVTENHFLAEESMMKEYHYPDLEVHQRAHRTLMVDLKKFCEKFDRLQTTITGDHMVILKHWFMDHVPSHDQLLAAFLLGKSNDIPIELKHDVYAKERRSIEKQVQIYLDENQCLGWLLEFNKQCDILGLKVLGLKSNPAIYPWLYFWEMNGNRFIIAHEMDTSFLNEICSTIYTYGDQESYYETLKTKFPTDKGSILICSSDSGILSGACGMSKSLLNWLELHKYDTKSAEVLLQHLGDEFPVERLDKVRLVASAIWNGFSHVHQALKDNQFNLEESEGRNGLKVCLRDFLLKENLFIDHDSISIQYGYQTRLCDALDTFQHIVHQTTLPITIRVRYPIVFFNHQRETIYEAVISFDLSQMEQDVYEKAFLTLLEAREKTIQHIQQSIESETYLMGFEADLFCRQLLIDAGYGNAIKFPMGHFADQQIVPFVAQLDNGSMKDTRRILPGHLLYFAPKLAFDDYGITIGSSLYLERSGIDYLAEEARNENIKRIFI